jgi:hypothetical protein
VRGFQSVFKRALNISSSVRIGVSFDTCLWSFD